MGKAQVNATREAAPTGMILNIMRFAVDDGPGLRTTFFLKGCPLACNWCHNPESQAHEPHLVWREGRCIRCGSCLVACPERAIRQEGTAYVRREEDCRLCGSCTTACYADAWEWIGREMGVGEALVEIRRDRPFYEQSGGGVTFSGGEPLAQPAFLAALLAGCRAEGIHTAVDTAGFAPYADFERINPDVDLYLYDLKILDDEVHRRATGASNETILANLRRLVQAGKRIVIRIPVIPGFNDDERAADRCGAFISSLAPTPVVELLPHHRTGESKYALLRRAYPHPAPAAAAPGDLERIARHLRRYGVRLRNGRLNPDE